MRFTTIAAAAAVAVSVFAGPVSAALITGQGNFASADGPYTFDDPQIFGPGPTTFAVGPRTVQWSASGASALLNSTFDVALLGRQWTTAGVGGFAAVYSGASMTFEFLNGPAAGFEIFYNHTVGAPAIMQALDDMGGVLESYDLGAVAPVISNLINDGLTAGILRPTEDISAIRFISGSGANDAVVIDDLTIMSTTAQPHNPQAVPVPASFAMTAGGIAFASFMAHRRSSRRKG